MLGAPKGSTIEKETDTEKYETMKSIEVLTEFLKCSQN